MNSVEEFATIAAHLEWLQGYLQSQPRGEDTDRMDSALNALVCARAVIVELTQIGGTPEPRAAAASL